MKVITSFFVACLIMIACGCNNKESKSNWYDYGNGVVNLSMVKNIRSKMLLTSNGATLDYYVVESKAKDVLFEGPINDDNIKELKDKVSNFSFDEELTGSASINFDDFTLTLPVIKIKKADEKDKLDTWLNIYNNLLTHINPR